MRKENMSVIQRDQNRWLGIWHEKYTGGDFQWSLFQVKGLFIGLEVRSSIAKIQVVIMVKCLDHVIP